MHMTMTWLEHTRPWMFLALLITLLVVAASIVAALVNLVN